MSLIKSKAALNADGPKKKRKKVSTFSIKVERQGYCLRFGPKITIEQ